MSEEAYEELSNNSEERPSKELIISNPLDFIEKFAEKRKKRIRESVQKENEYLGENDSVQPHNTLLENSFFSLAVMALLQIMSTSGIRDLEIKAILPSKKAMRPEALRVMNRMAGK